MWRDVVLSLLFMALIAACGRSVAPTPEELPPLATAEVPPIAEIDAAIQRWENSDNRNYFVEVGERTPESNQKVRVVVVDGQVRAAQQLLEESKDHWGEPTALSLDLAKEYTVGALLDRVRRDALGAGPAPLNMRVVFDPSIGFPLAVHAEALPTYNEKGNIELNRQFSYDLSVTVRALVEDTYGVGQEAVLTLTRSGGAQAWCDKLRIFSDGSSVYGDDCRNVMLQLDLPAAQWSELQHLKDAFGSLDDLRQENGASQQLIIVGSSEGTPDAATLQSAWELANRASSMLSRPIGLGLTLLYIQKGELWGFDVFHRGVQIASLDRSGELYGAALSLDQKNLAYSDAAGLHVFDLAKGTTADVLPPPDGGHYLPRTWSNSGYLLLSYMPESEKGISRLGWVSLAAREFHELPLPPDSEGYGCDTGAAWSPDGARLAITGLGYDHACNLSPGLTVVDMVSGSARRIVAIPLRPGSTGGETVLAGAHTPAWSLDGQWIAFGLDQESTGITGPLNPLMRLYRVRADGGNLTPLTGQARAAANPVWAPDGMLYYSLSGVSAEAEGIYRYNPMDNTHTLILSAPTAFPLSISPDGEFLAYEQAGDLEVWGFARQETLEVTSTQDGEKAIMVGWLANQP